MNLLSFSKQCKNIIKPIEHTAVLLYYGIVAPKLKNYLKGKEIAVKNWIPFSPMPYLIKRGSKLEPLFIEEFEKAITPEFLKTRAEIKQLKDAKPKITKQQAKIWDYFLPRKLSDLFYATNNESQGKQIERIFFDIDRGNLKPEDAQQVALKLVEQIASDKKFNLKGKPSVMWTGSSFHVYYILKKPIPNTIYTSSIAYSKNNPLASFTGRWADNINKQIKIKVKGGHEKIKNCINIDPSQTPSGKLCRSVFSLHMADAKTIDGIALPLTTDMLKDKNLVKELKTYTPEKTINNLNELSKRLP